MKLIGFLCYVQCESLFLLFLTICKMCGGEDNTTSMSLKRQAPISLHVFRVEPFHYTCEFKRIQTVILLMLKLRFAVLGEDIVTSELQEVGSHGPCLAYFSSFITALSGPPDDDADKIAANSLAQMHPMIEDGHNYNLWVALFYGCKLRVRVLCQHQREL